MKRVLITGITGFTGRYVSQELIAHGYEVYGLSREGLSDSVAGALEVFRCSLGDQEKLMKILDEVKPNYVVHLAGISFVAHSNVADIYETNFLGTRILLESLKQQCADCLKSVLLSSSANVYGNYGGERLGEDTPLSPVSDYAVSKAAMEYLVGVYKDALPLVITRPFNYTGIGQAESFLIPKIISHIKQGCSNIELGNLDVSRDFSDVRMVASSYRQLLENSASVGKIFNVCTGKPYSLKEVLEIAMHASGHKISVTVNQAFVRESEVKILTGDPSRLHCVIKKTKYIPLEETIQWMLEAK